MAGTTTVLWFRRDLRLHDHPALSAAAAEAGRSGAVVPLFVLDDVLWGRAGPARRGWLARSLRALHGATDGTLVVRRGRPSTVVPAVAQEVAAGTVHVTGDGAPYGRRRDAAVARVLDGAGRRLLATGTPYAVDPGTVRKADGTPFTVYSPYARAWAARPVPAPAPGPPRSPSWARDVPGEDLPEVPDAELPTLPPAGEDAAVTRWREFLRDVDDYDSLRDRPDLNRTSQLSAHLKYGEIHPRTLLAELAGRTSTGAETFRRELVWREFYADVLWHRPDSAWGYLRPDLAGMAFDEPGERFEAWREGRTGYPLVDAGMRQMRHEGWMHNRVRMVTASFLVKDLHVEWQHGAREFLHWLRDGDLASNNHGWQWVAGSGTDPAPFFRVFNPVRQGLTYDPDGVYVRRHVPELAHLEGAAAHEPWRHPHGYDRGYPERIVDHGVERAEALRRYDAVRDRR